MKAVLSLLGVIALLIVVVVGGTWLATTKVEDPALNDSGLLVNVTSELSSGASATGATSQPIDCDYQRTYADKEFVEACLLAGKGEPTKEPCMQPRNVWRGPGPGYLEVYDCSWHPGPNPRDGGILQVAVSGDPNMPVQGYWLDSIELVGDEYSTFAVIYLRREFMPSTANRLIVEIFYIDDKAIPALALTRSDVSSIPILGAHALGSGDVPVPKDKVKEIVVTLVETVAQESREF